MAENRNRKVQRLIEEQQLKNDKWIKSLNFQQRTVIQEYAAKQVDKVAANILCQIETCYAGAFVELWEDKLTYDEIEQVFEVANRMLKENGQFLEDEGEGWKMKLDKLTPQVKERVIDLLEKNFNQKTIVEQIGKEYPELKSSHINLAYKTAKEEWMKPKTNKPAAAPVKKVTKKEAAKVAEEVAKEIEKEVTVSEIVEAPENTEFEVISKKIVLAGKHGEYTIENGTLEVGKDKFSCETDLNLYLDTEYQRLSELKAAWGKVN